MPEAEYDLVMPFVLVQSVGGEYDDNAYVAGWRLGELWTLLQVAEATGLDVPRVTLPLSDAPQVDLIAMRFGFSVYHSEHEDGVFATFEFKRAYTPELED